MLKKIADKKYEELKEEAHSEISLIKKVAQEGISSITKAVEKKSQQIQILHQKLFGSKCY